MFMARRSRTVGRAQPREERRFVASAMGNLWSRTSALSDEVHGAMLARGYAGAPKSLLRFAMKPSDWIWIVLTLVVGMLFMGGERVFA
jgi:cobalt/nickel transport system permease protein